MFVENPSHKKGMQKPGKTEVSSKKGETMEGYTGIKGGMSGCTMEHHSKLLHGKKLEPKVMKEYFKR
ncbi:MAG: hypothetical protein ACYC6W_11005 [Nitrosotalea sp.]